jgi:hypothetical protein
LVSQNAARQAVKDAQAYIDSITGDRLQNEIAAAQAEVVLTKHRLENATDNYEKYKDEDESNTTRATYRVQLSEAQRAYDEAVRQLDNLQGDGYDFTLKQANTTLETASTQLKLAEAKKVELSEGPDQKLVAAGEARLAAAEAGLDVFEIKHRQERFGLNMLTPHKGKSPFVRFLMEFNNPLIIILLVASLVTAVLKDPLDAFVIFGVVLINAIIGYIQEARAEQAISALAKTMTTEANVIRGEKVTRVSAAELVPGDIVQFQAGTRVPADLRLVTSRDLQVNEAALTGESLPVAKDAVSLVQHDAVLAERGNMAYASTFVTYGGDRCGSRHRGWQRGRAYLTVDLQRHRTGNPSHPQDRPVQPGAAGCDPGAFLRNLRYQCLAEPTAGKYIDGGDRPGSRCYPRRPACCSDNNPGNWPIPYGSPPRHHPQFTGC